MHWAKKYKKITISILIILGLVVSSVPSLSFFSAQSAYATSTKQYSTMSSQDQTTSWILYKAILQCMNTGASISTSASDIAAGKLFSGGGQAPALPYLRGEGTAQISLSGVGSDQLTDCSENNSQLTSKAFSWWGIDPIDFMCSMPKAAWRSDGTDCHLSKGSDFYYTNSISNNGSANNGGYTYIANAFKSYLNSHVYGGNLTYAPGNNIDQDFLTGAQKYYFYHDTVLSACITPDSGGLPSPQSSKPNGSKVYALQSLTSVNGVETSQTQYYIGSKDLTDGVSAYPSGNGTTVGGFGGGHNWNLTCQQLLDRSNAAIASAIADANRQAALAACTQKGYTGSLLQACAQGASNKGNDAAWCKNLNWNIIGIVNTTADAMTNACIDGLGLTVSAQTPQNTSCSTSDPSCDNSKTTCAIDGIGWIVCPVVNFLANLSDGAFRFISDSLLQTNTQIVSTDSPTYRAWSIMQSFANIAFVIAFLFIIFSQLTGFGVTNYGVKKMLPRLVVAAILVNISFFICQIAVDLSNILGYSLSGLFNNIGAKVVNISSSNDGVSPFASGSGFAGIAGGALALTGAGVLMYALLSALIPILLAAILALVMILAMLVARQALIVILIVIAPLAFVAYLFPNMEKLFTQWRKMLTGLLLLFPIIALVFGLSSLASTIVTYTFSGDVSSTTDAKSANSFFGQIMGAAILVLPLFAVPILLKKSLDGIPMVGQLANKWSNRANGRLGSKLKEGYRGSLIGRGAAIRKHAKDNYRTKRYAEKISKGGFFGTANRVMSSGIPLGPNSMGAEANKALLKSATATVLKATRDDREEAKAVIEEANLSGAQRQTLALTGEITYKDANGRDRTIKGEAYQTGALEMQLKTGSMDDIKDIVAKSSDTSASGLYKHRQIISQNVAANGLGAKDPAMSGKYIDQISQGTFNYDAARRSAMTEGKVTAEVLASMHDNARAAYVKIAEDEAMAGNNTYMSILHEAKDGIMKSPVLYNNKIQGNPLAENQLGKIV